MAVPELLTLEVSLVIALLAFLIGLGYPLLASRRYACIFLIAILFLICAFYCNQDFGGWYPF